MNKKDPGAVLVMIWVVLAVLIGPIGPVSAEMSETESFVRARIEIGESMGDYMRDMRSRGGYDSESGRPSMEQMQKMEEEINSMVDGILGDYGMTLEEYEARSPEIFSDGEAVELFLEAHPDLRERYEVLPFHRARPRRGPP